LFLNVIMELVLPKRHGPGCSEGILGGQHRVRVVSFYVGFDQDNLIDGNTGLV
jgi:hypothetical protein